MPFKPANSDLKRHFNRSLSKVRVCIEQAFGRISALFGGLKNEYMTQVGLSAPGAAYLVATFFTNLRTCADEGNQISQYFGLTPPSVEEYVAMVASERLRRASE